MFWLLGIYLLVFFTSIVAFLGLVIALPATYFSKNRNIIASRHPILRWLGLIAKNLLGVAIVVLGILLSLPGIPGQGLLTIVIGAMLIDFPGKRRLVKSVARRRGVLN